MGYDEKKFKTKANIKARRLWLVFALLLTVNYGVDTANGAYSIRNFIIFAAGIFLFSIQASTVSRLTPRYSQISFIEYQRSMVGSMEVSSLSGGFQ